MSSDEFNLLMILQNEPKASLRKIANNLSIAPSTARLRIQKMRDKSLIRGTKAQYVPSTLDLETITYLVEISSLDNIKKLESLCNAHNYTVYRNRITGKLNGLYIQFNVPSKGTIHLKKLFDILLEKGLINSYRRLHTIKNHSFETRPDIKFFDRETQHWTWDAETWFNSLPSASSIKLEPIIQKSTFEKINAFDMTLLRQLTRDSDFIQKDFAEKMKVEQYYLTRRKNLLEETVVNKYRLIFDRTLIQLHDLLIFEVETTKEEALRLGWQLAWEQSRFEEKYVPFKVKKLTQSGEEETPEFKLNGVDPFPFSSSFYFTEKGFLWRINLPPGLSTHISEYLWEISKSFSVYRLDHKYPKHYWFYHKNYDEKKGEWVTSKEWMIDDPLKSINII
ncbi:MAG: winged helix-turn-helix transcriptional regulator [Candidatus Kariarchaeaceae archaeon]